MISKHQFFVHFILEILIASFFIFLAILLLIRGWEFSTIFCCVFATFSISNAIRMLQSYIAMRKLINEASELIEKNFTFTETEDKDSDSSKE